LNLGAELAAGCIHFPILLDVTAREKIRQPVRTASLDRARASTHHLCVGEIVSGTNWLLRAAARGGSCPRPATHNAPHRNARHARFNRSCRRQKYASTHTNPKSIFGMIEMRRASLPAGLMIGLSAGLTRQTNARGGMRDGRASPESGSAAASSPTQLRAASSRQLIRETLGRLQEDQRARQAAERERRRGQRDDTRALVRLAQLESLDVARVAAHAGAEPAFPPLRSP
jgi:hypothetical protein